MAENHQGLLCLSHVTKYPLPPSSQGRRNRGEGGGAGKHVSPTLVSLFLFCLFKNNCLLI